MADRQPSTTTHTDPLGQSEERFRRAFEDSGVGMLMVELDGSFRWANNAFCKFLGYSKNEILAKSIADITHPADIKAGLDGLEKMIAGKIFNFNVEKRYLHKDGSTIWAHLNSSIVFGEDEKPSYMISHLQDISQRKAMEAELQNSREEMERQIVERTAKLCESEARLNQVQSIAHLGSWTWNLVTGEIYWSAEHFKIFGMDPDGPAPTIDDFKNSLHPDGRQFVIRALDDAKKGIRDDDIEYRIVRPDGEIRYIYAQALLSRNAEGEPESLLGTTLDITHRKLTENLLRENEARLNEAQSLANLGSWTRIIATGEEEWSNELYNIFGLDPDGPPPTYDVFLNAVHPDDMQDATALLACF